LNGAADVTLGEQAWRVEQGQAFLADCRNGRNISIPGDAEWLTVGLQASVIGRDLLSRIGLPILWQPDENSWCALEFYLRELTRHFYEEGAAMLVRDGLARAVTGLILRSHDMSELSPSSRGHTPFWLPRVMRLARENPGVSVAQLAREAGFSPAQFRRVFHDWSLMSPHEFLQRERLELASRLLESTDLPVEEIARRCGFAGASSFARTFRAFADFSPAAYREAARDMTAQQA
jgi:AraC-like DNA-binding protein